MEVFLGFDPGGKGTFGWCVAYVDGDGFLTRLASGLEDYALLAVSSALAAVPEGGVVAGAGIDAPLYWSRSGSRSSDVTVRAAIKRAGAKHAAGKVQDVNSLRGACLIQGMLAALELRERYPDLLITEAHPKALLWLYPPAKLVEGRSEHERDALLAALAASVAVKPKDGWQDLLETERSPYSPVSQPLHYFMPGVP